MTIRFRHIRRFLRHHGWQLGWQTGSHEQYIHPTHAGLVTVAGHDSDDVPKAILRSILLQAGLTMEEFQEFE